MESYLKLALSDLRSLTTVTRGPRKGQVKARTWAAWIRLAVIRELSAAGYIEAKANTIHGDGYAVTPLGLLSLDQLKE